MTNEARVVITADDDVDKGLASARGKLFAFADDVGKGISTTAKLGQRMGEDVIGGLKGIGPHATAILGGAAVAASPVIGAAISGAIIGGAGAGGVAGAFLVAKNDARVVSAIDGMGKRLQDRLEGAVGPFVPVALGGIKRIEGAINTINFDRIFANAGRDMGPLLDGVSSLIEDVGDSFELLSDKAGPVMETIGDGIAEIGEAVGDGLDSLADNAEEGASGLEFLFDVIETGVDSAFMLVNALTEIWSVLDDTEMLTELIGWYADLGDGAEDTAGKQDELKTSSDSVKTSFEDQKSALEQLNEEYKKQTDPAFALLDAIDGMAEAQKKYNEAVKEHGEDSPEAEQALRDVAKAAGLLSGAAGEAGDAFTGEMTPAMEKMLIEAGLSKDQINALKKQLREAKDAADDWEGKFEQTYVVRYSYQGRQSPVGGGYENSPSYGSDRAMGGVTGAASGGNRNGMTWVGEQGPELVDLPAGATVHTAGDSQRMMRQNGSSGGVAQIELMARRGASRELMDLLIENLQYIARTEYNGSAQEMIGQAGVMV